MNHQLFLQGIRINQEKIAPDSYLLNIPAVASLEELVFRGPVTFFCGENGSGKSTLLEAIAVACGFNPEGGTRNYRFSTYDSHADLYKAITPLRTFRTIRHGYFLRAETFYNTASAEEEYGRETGYSAKYHHMSHGESFLKVLQDNFSGDGLFLLDEPEAGMSPQRLLTLLIEIHRAVQEGAQFIISTHSPILSACPGAEILSFSERGIEPCPYEETEAYRITKMFLQNRERFLEQLFAD